MADEDVEVNADEGRRDDGDDGGGEELEAKKSFLKSKLLLIVAGVFLLLIIAGGSYYFFFTSEEELESIESTAETLDGASPAEDESQMEQTKLAPMAEQMGFVQATNADDSETSTEDSTNGIAEMQQHIEALEAKLDQIESMLQSQKNIPADAENLPLQYPDNFDYQQGFSDSSAMRLPSGPPPPKPSWGEFNRIN